MADATYQPKVYRKSGGDAQIVASGGYVDIETGGELRLGGTAITATAAEINAAAGTGVSSTELDLLDGALAGTAVANKALALGATKNVDTLVIADSGLFLGAGAGTAVSATAAELNYNDLVTLGTGAASKAVVLDTGEDYVWPATGILTYGVLKDPAGTTLGATVDEINRAADVSARLVTILATGNITAAANEGRVNLLGDVGGDTAVTLDLPAATGSGARYLFIVSVANTSNYVIRVNATPGTDIMRGTMNLLDNDAAAQAAYASITGDTITLNGTTTGGQIGDFVELIDVLSGVWHVMGQGMVPAGSNPATPFSATVP